MIKIEEFPRHITKYDDIKEKYSNKYVSENFKDMNMDMVVKRENGNLINIEHHSSINSNALRRNYDYCVNLFSITKKQIEPFIFYTGELPIKSVIYLNDIMFFYPTWIMTKKIEGQILLNNINYKIKNHEKINVYDILDLVWLPKCRIDIEINDLMFKLIEIYETISAEEYLLNVLKDCLALWAMKLINDKKVLKQFLGRLNMQNIKLESIDEMLKKAYIQNRINYAEEKAMEKGEQIGMEKGEQIGIKKGEQKGMKKLEKAIILLLETTKPEKISEKLKIPIETIQEIQNQTAQNIE